MTTPKKKVPKKKTTKKLHIKKSFPEVNSLLSPDQKLVFDHSIDWLNLRTTEHLTIGGYAGTGKTTLISILRKHLKNENPNLKVAMACYTGKASQNLRNKLVSAGALYPSDTCGTIHQLIYKPVTNDDGEIITWKRNQEIECDLIIVDEASMIQKQTWDDLAGYGIPILAVGDHGQLPPIDDDFNLMDTPDFKLEKIHRQAADNPIIHLATLARNGEPIPLKKYSSTVQKFHMKSDIGRAMQEQLLQSVHKDTLVLCGTNVTRQRLNHDIRSFKQFFSQAPSVGEQVVCLKNSYEKDSDPIYNGMLGTIEKITPYKDHWYDVIVHFAQEDRRFGGRISKEQFGQKQLLLSVPGVFWKDIGDRFDFGYALTVHKAQGSQARRVVLFDESFYFREKKNQWLYTAITRAEEELFIFGY
jgi:exodeoxyribonuclease V